MNERRKTILFICRHNAGRSQMAEGIINHLHSERYQAWSAGSRPGTINPYAVIVMGEVGIDISGQRPKRLDDLEVGRFDYVVTMCSDDDDCPFYPGLVHLHQGFPDPSIATGTEEEKLAAVRAIRDEIITWSRATFK